MATIPGLQLRPTQNLLMTPQLRQALQILQMTSMEVSALVEQELQENPFLTAEDENPEPPSPPDAAEPRHDGPAGQNETLLDTDFLTESESGGYADTYSDDGAPRDWRARHDSYADMADLDPPCGEPSLVARLLEQVRLEPTLTHAGHIICRSLIAHLDPVGRLDCDPSEIARETEMPLDEVEAVRRFMMSGVEPAGLFARDLAECLAAQLRARNRLDPAMVAMIDNLDMVARRNYTALRALCGVDEADFADMLAELRHLDPKPGVEAAGEAALTRVPDVIVSAGPDGGWRIGLNEEAQPRLLVDQGLRRKVLRETRGQDREFARARLSQASWLIRALEQRNRTLLRVVSEIMEKQRLFLEKGPSGLSPLIMKTIAELTGLHESTVSRAAAGKYVATPQGVFDLKYFFTSSVRGRSDSDSHSSEAIKYRIRHMIDAEKADIILSDDDIMQMLRKEGIDIARRTVAKYRESLHIANSVQRKREKAASA